MSRYDAIPWYLCPVQTNILKKLLPSSVPTPAQLGWLALFSKKEEDLTAEDKLKNKDLNNEDNVKSEDNTKNKDKLKTSNYIFKKHCYTKKNQPL